MVFPSRQSFFVRFFVTHSYLVDWYFIVLSLKEFLVIPSFCIVEELAATSLLLLAVVEEFPASYV